MSQETIEIEHLYTSLHPLRWGKPHQDQADVQEVGRVLSVGDGIARIYGLKGVKAVGLGGPLCISHMKGCNPKTLSMRRSGFAFFDLWYNEAQSEVSILEKSQL